MSINTKQMVSEKSDDLCDYLVVTELPTHFRSYETKEIYVRGLYFDESEALAKYVGYGKPSYTQLAAVYDDVIRGIEIKKLEVVDFIVLMIISSIWTVDGFGWDPKIRCSNFINDEQCNGVINDPIVLDDFDFNDPVLEILPIPVQLKGKQYNIGAQTIGDLIEKESYMKKNPEITDKLLDYALSIKNSDLSIEDKLKIIKFSFAREVAQIKEIDSEVHIKINPVEKKCPACGHVNKLKIGLTQIRGYP